MNLAEAFVQAAERVPQKVAVYSGARTLTFAELLEQSARVATSLRLNFGLAEGDRVAVWLKNEPEFIPALFGIFRAGAVVVPLNIFLKPAEVAFLLDDSEARVLITDSAGATQLAPLLCERPNLQCLRSEEVLNLPVATSTPSLPACREHDLAVIIYTSGTTGRPKGAMLSHGNLLANVASSRIALQITEEDRMAVVLPMFHSFMLCVGIMLPLFSGAAVVVIRSLNPHHQFCEDISRHRATLLPAIPQVYRNLVNSPPAGPLSLRLCVSGAAPLPVQILRDFNAKFSVPLIEGYGLSEASPEVTKNPLNGVRKPGSIGRPIPGVEVTIQNDAGEILPCGERGELCVRGPNVMLGYWKRPDETARAFRQGWLLTGDIAYQDEDGYLFITDRKKDMLLVNGISVYSREIEEILYQFPGVKEAAVIGIPDERRGELPVAYVVANDGILIQEMPLLRFLRERLADYKVPRRVTFMPALPRNAGGKILKTELRTIASREERGV